MHLLHPAAPVEIISIAVLILATTIHITEGAPQSGNGFFKDLSDLKIKENNKPNENTYLKHFLYKRQVLESVDTKVDEVGIHSRREAATQEEHSGTPYHHSVHKRETPVENDGKQSLDVVEPSLFYVGKRLQDLEHKILVRQVDETGNPGQTGFRSDDLVASLIRQRDDFIAAAAIPVPPLPVQTIRLNSNSGL